MEDGTLKKAAIELTTMAQIYMEKDMLDKAAEVMELAERIERGLHGNSNVIDLSAWEQARQHIQSRQVNAANLKG